MIVGIGTDLVSVLRMEAALQRRGSALARRLLSEEEYEEFQASAQQARFLASRFAAREAALKALGVGLSAGIRWTDLRVGKNEDGAPMLGMRRAAAKCAQLLGADIFYLSLAHERDYALAFVILCTSSTEISVKKRPPPS